MWYSLTNKKGITLGELREIINNLSEFPDDHLVYLQNNDEISEKLISVKADDDDICFYNI